uniref:Uncharacterized protein n=1 Tax=Timema tahoe TaxID=61484 RepID=A0A7R9FJ71_9NEOP|nr:unnamed protein product [Timema tahoe]
MFKVSTYSAGRAQLLRHSPSFGAIDANEPIPHPFASRSPYKAVLVQAFIMHCVRPGLEVPLLVWSGLVVAAAAARNVLFVVVVVVVVVEVTFTVSLCIAVKKHSPDKGHFTLRCLRRYCVAGARGATVEVSQSNDRFRIWGVESGRTRIGSALTWCALWTQDYQDNNRPASSLTNEEITYHGSDQDPHCQGKNTSVNVRVGGSEVLTRRRSLPTAGVPPPPGEGCTSLRGRGGEARVQSSSCQGQEGRPSSVASSSLFYGNVVSLKEESEGDGRFLVFRVLLSVFQTPRTMPVGIRSPATEQGRPTANNMLPAVITPFIGFRDEKGYIHRKCTSISVEMTPYYLEPSRKMSLLCDDVNLPLPAFDLDTPRSRGLQGHGLSLYHRSRDFQTDDLKIGCVCVCASRDGRNFGRPSEDLALDAVGYNVIFLSPGTNCRRHVWNE